MPMMPGPLAAIPYLGIKFVGYTLAAFYLNRRSYVTKPVSPAKLGGMRTIIGVVAGVPTTMVLLSIYRNAGSFEILYAWMAPVRFVEWLAVIWFLYRPKRIWAIAPGTDSILGVGYSFALDLLAGALISTMPWLMIPFC